MKTYAFALAASFAATGAAFDCSGPYFSFYNRGGPSMSYQRLDPALYPGVESPHLHSFDGGNHISASMTFADTQAADCTTARIKPDKSNYWRPTLFWNGNGTGFYRVPDTYLKIYYKFGDSGNVKANVSEFPGNFRMIAGNAMLRHDDGVVGTNNGPGLQWSCKQPNYQDVNAIGFPKGFTSCPDGFAAQLTFPSCWNGKDLDPSNPSAHMAYPTAGGLGLAACPSGFQVARFPSIFIEFWYDVSAFDNQYSADSIPWVLSMGDPTGYGFHADFLNGWEKGVLGKATADTGYCNCGCGCGQTEMETCFGTENVNDDSDADFKSCSATPEFPGDDGTHFTTLPGCNPIQSGPADATKVTGAGCSATAISASGAASAAASSIVTSSVAVSPASASVAYSSIASPSSVGAMAVTLSSAAAPSAPIVTSSAGNNGGYGVASSNAATSVAAGSTAVSSSAPESESVAAGSTPYVSYAESYAPSSAVVGASSIEAVASSIQTSGSLAALSSAFTLPSSEVAACGPPITVTFTPTVYVTASPETCSATVYTTVTNTATVTVPAGYKHVKKHLGMHKHRI